MVYPVICAWPTLSLVYLVGVVGITNIIVNKVAQEKKLSLYVDNIYIIKCNEYGVFYVDLE